MNKGGSQVCDSVRAFESFCVSSCDQYLHAISCPSVAMIGLSDTASNKMEKVGQNSRGRLYFIFFFDTRIRAVGFFWYKYFMSLIILGASER